MKTEVSKVSKKLKWAKPSLSWVVWFFPLVAIAITAWLTMDYLKQRGPLVEIKFPDASSVEAQKTPVRFRGITVGKVERIELTEDTKEVLIFVRLTRQAKKLAVEGAKFWIVQPEVDFEGVRGLETIFRGPYIRVEPGQLDGEFKRQFVGHIGEPSSTAYGMVTYNLRSDVVDSIDVNDPVSYRGLKIGMVSGVDLDKTAQSIRVRIKVESRYSRLVRTNTVFWKKSGVDADVGLFGAKVKIGSLETLMKGGVALATPAKPGAKAESQSNFTLQAEAPKDWLKWNPEL